MYKLIFIVTIGLISTFFSACSHFTFNATMCDQIASDPLATMPEECRIYNEDEAQKSFDNSHNKRIESNETIEFTKEK